MEKVFEFIPRQFFEIVVITIFSLIIGLSQKALHVSKADQNEATFGTDRTFTFIGILGYILWITDASKSLYFAGLILLTILLAVNYYFKISLYHEFGLTTIAVAFITYSLTALLKTQPFWLFMLVYVIVLVLTELKDSLNAFSKKVARDEFLTLGKFLAIAGIVLPMVPDTPIVAFLELTPYKIWLAVVVISSISYLSYLLRRFVFQDSGIVVTGILGGLYSSTATTIVLARQSRKTKGGHHHVVAAILMATTMMYLRIGILMAIFNAAIFTLLLPWFLVMFGVSAGASIGILYFRKKTTDIIPDAKESPANPLEFRIAIIFTLLYVAFSFITYFTIQQFGTRGLQVLAYIVGITDIDPFLINLFNGKFGMEMTMVGVATLQAIFSNNLIKLVYALVLSAKECRKLLLIGFGIILAANFLIIWIFA